MLPRRLITVVTAGVVGIGLMPPASQAAPSQLVTAAASATVTSLPAARTAKPRAAVLRVATFNVRTARATQDKRKWLQRVPDVAREILDRNPGVVALQELGPGRADGKKAKLNGAARQTTSLTTTLKRLGGGRYRLVRSTAYVAPGSKYGTQGARILYDASRYSLLSRCIEATGKRAYHPSCSFTLPVAAGDSPEDRRAAAYSEFRDRRTGQRFYVVSAHLDARHSGNTRIEAKYNLLRARQAATVANVMARVNRARQPVIFGGDINSWQTDSGRYAPHRALVARGYSDAATARTRVNLAYPTINKWRTTLKKAKNRPSVRLDVVMAKGARGFRRYENKMAEVDPQRPSDHNMVLADIVLS
jgi:endonuclease/exonuclease/phosphatase family metal-dependent hydrolase